MSFKETCKKIRENIIEDLNKDGPYAMKKDDVEFTSNELKTFFSKIKKNGLNIFSGGKGNSDNRNNFV